jgi:hypothetical protein
MARTDAGEYALAAARALEPQILAGREEMENVHLPLIRKPPGTTTAVPVGFVTPPVNASRSSGIPARLLRYMLRTP